MKLPFGGTAKTLTLQLLLSPKLLLLRLRRRQKLPPIEELRSVLIVKLDAMGDTVLLTPFLRQLRLQSPRASVTLLLRRGVHEALEGSNLADEIRPVRSGKTRLGRVGIALLAAIGTWRHRFDAAIVPRWDVDYYDAALIAALSRSRHVLGYSERVSEHKGRINWRYDQYFTHTIFAPGAVHEVIKNLRFLECFGGVIRTGPLVVQGEPLPVEVERILAGSRGRTIEKRVAFGIGASAANRRWPVDSFAELASRLIATGLRPVLIGGKEDRIGAGRISEICGTEKIVDLTGRLSIRASCEAIRRCMCFVGNDSGPMHLAAAARVPVVEISSFPRTGNTDHFTSVTRFGPWGVEAAILQPEQAESPCSDACRANRAHCILQLEVEDVSAAVQALVGSVATRMKQRVAFCGEGRIEK